MTAATLHQLSGGRFVLGLGASSRQLVEGWHHISYDRPAGPHDADSRARERRPGGALGRSEGLLDEFTVYGTAATVPEQLARWDATVVGLPPGLPWPRIEATVRAAAPPQGHLFLRG
jgi:alkanesulfonate monooxygenase SsuD/methylene tetrahydromethanopterin reductase-like flavin-dependent oxidoreductase (luciferase family)